MVLSEYCMRPPLLSASGTHYALPGTALRSRSPVARLAVEIRLGQTETAARLRWGSVGENNSVRHCACDFHEDFFRCAQTMGRGEPEAFAYPVRDHIDGGSYQEGLQPSKRRGQRARSAHDSQEFEYDLGRF